MARRGTVAGPSGPSGRPPVLTRPELLGRLGSGARVTLVAAPAGSGKTSLLRSWAAAAPRGDDVAWCTVARGGSDAQRFWLGVIRALRETPAGARLVGAVTAAPELDAGRVAARLRDELAGLEEPLWLVVDDLHELDAPDALQQLEALIADGPPALRFVLATRRDVRLGLHRLRLDGALTELRGADLRFTAAEARDLFRAAGVDVSPATLERLVSRTEGWAAGLRLAALSLAGHPDPDRFAADFSGSDRTVADYLLAEVLERQPDDVRRLLLRTSILEWVTGPLADRLTGDGSGARILDELERAGAFVVAVDRQRTTFRYHQLFAELLDAELRRTAPDEVAALHTAAAEWFAEHGGPVEAVRHAQAARDWELAARLLSAHWASLYLDGRRVEGHALLRAFPPGVLDGDAGLAAVAVADELSSGSLDEAGRRLARASEGVAAVPEERRARVEVTLATLRLSLARQRNDADAVADEAARLLSPAHGPAVALDDDLRAIALVSLGIALVWRGRAEEAEDHLEAARALSHRSGRPMIEVGALSFLALAGGVRSQALAEQRSHAAIDLARAHGWEAEPFVAVAYAVLATLRLWRGRLAEADERLALGERALRTETEPATRFLLRTVRARLELARGNDAAALAAFDEALRAGGALVMPDALVAGVRAHALVARLRAGQAVAAEQALGALDPAARATPELAVASAALALEQGRPEDALTALVPATAAGGAAPGDRWRTQALILAAIAHDALGDAGATSRALEAALDLAEPDGVVLPFLLFPARELLERHGRLGTAHAGLIAEVVTILSGRAPGPVAADVEPLAEPLSDSELRVLRYLPTNLSAPEIAAELFVSVNTIRTHMRHVYAKLGVHQRSDAVARGRALGLLAPGPPAR